MTTPSFVTVTEPGVVTREAEEGRAERFYPAPTREGP
jgi:hypothetical protein